MKNIDVKSLLIGILATALLFACADADKISPSIVSEAKAATGVNDKWDDKQEWLECSLTALKRMGVLEAGDAEKGEFFWHIKDGWEPFGNDNYRKRIK